MNGGRIGNRKLGVQALKEGSDGRLKNTQKGTSRRTSSIHKGVVKSGDSRNLGSCFPELPPLPRTDTDTMIWMNKFYSRMEAREKRGGKGE